jgi:LPPG:FO 2-phospho-L-lactate transferase
VAQAYQDFLKILVVDTRDAQAAKQLQHSGLAVHAANTLMRTKDEKVELARTVLSLLGVSTARAAEPS